MKKSFLFLSVLLCTLNVCAQFTSTAKGAWTNNANWNTVYPGTLTVNVGDDNLAFSSETISVDTYLITGSSSNRIDMTFANSNDIGSITIEDADTLIIYGDVSFANKSMALNIGADAVLIIIGDATFANKVDVATSGTIVVSGDFSKSGGQGTYTGGGAVYAGSYSGGADDFIPGDTGTGGDQQQTIDDLSDDGFPEIEKFVEEEGAAEPLPVKLIYFNNSLENKVILKWATATEINNDYFSVERSEDGEFFYEIDKIAGNGNSNEVIEYSFEDKFVLAPVEYYRLKQVDYNGDYEYFSAIRVETNVQTSESQLMIFPTIVKDQIIRVKSNSPFELKELTIYSIDGKSVNNMMLEAYKENQITYRINLSLLKKGIYFVKMISTSGQEFSSKLSIK